MPAKRRVPTDAQKAEYEALSADPIGNADREEPETEPLGYVDPASQEEPKQPAKKAAAKKAAPSAVTRDDTKGDANA